MKVTTLFLTLAAVSAITLGSAYACNTCGCRDKKKETIADVSIADLKQMIADKKVVVIDVNGTSSYTKGHIPTALDFQALGKDGLAKAMPEDKSIKVVAYCGGPSCGAYKKAVKAAKDLGYTNVAHLSAGISGWMKAGEDTEKG